VVVGVGELQLLDTAFRIQALNCQQLTDSGGGFTKLFFRWMLLMALDVVRLISINLCDRHSRSN